MTAVAPLLAASYDPRPGDEARYENAIARRNAAILAYREAEALLTAARLRGYTDLRDWIGNLNATQHEYEWAHRDLIRARVVFQADRKPWGSNVAEERHG